MIQPLSLKDMQSKDKLKDETTRKNNSKSDIQQNAKTFICIQNKSRKYSQKSLQNLSITAHRRLNTVKC